MAFNPPLVDNEVPSSAKWNQAVAAYDRSTSTVDVVSTTTETTIFTKSIAGGDMSSDRMLRLTLLGDYLQNAAGTFTVRVKLGATTLWDESGSVATDANRIPLSIVLALANLGATNSQFLKGELFIGNNTTPPTTGLGDLNSAPARLGAHFSTNGLAAIDTTVAQTLAVTIQWSASSASLSFRKRYAILELL